MLCGIHRGCGCLGMRKAALVFCSDIEMRLGDWIRRGGSGQCLTCFPGVLGRCVPREFWLMLETWIMGRVGGRIAGGEDLCDPLGMVSERKGRPWQVFLLESLV